MDKKPFELKNEDIEWFIKKTKEVIKEESDKGNDITSNDDLFAAVFKKLSPVVVQNEKFREVVFFLAFEKLTDITRDTLLKIACIDSTMFDKLKKAMPEMVGDIEEIQTMIKNMKKD